jgi:hypothetical protein
LTAFPRERVRGLDDSPVRAKRRGRVARPATAPGDYGEVTFPEMLVEMVEGRHVGSSRPVALAVALVALAATVVPVVRRR